MSAIKGTIFTVGDLVKRLQGMPNHTPLYFDDSNNAPLFEEEWNAEGECEGINIMAGLEHSDTL